MLDPLYHLNDCEPLEPPLVVNQPWGQDQPDHVIRLGQIGRGLLFPYRFYPLSHLYPDGRQRDY